MRNMLCLAVLLAACGSAAPPATSAFIRSESGIEIAVTLAPTASPTRGPTSTPKPTSTSIPTATDLPTALPPTREPTPTFAPSWTPVPRPTATRAPAVTSTPIPVLVVPADTSAKPISANECPAAYPIKGNKNSMIYHMPGGASYKTTKPEECFATEAAAQAAGYRKAAK